MTMQNLAFNVNIWDQRALPDVASIITHHVPAEVLRASDYMM